MDEQEDNNSKRAEVMDLPDIQPPTLAPQMEDFDTPESMDDPNVPYDIVEADLNEDSWQKPYMDYLLQHILPEDIKL